MFAGDNEEVPLRTPDHQAEIRRHLFHNIAASWFPKAAGFAQKAKADIWAPAKAFPSSRATNARAAGAERDSPLLPTVVCDPTG